MSFKILIRELEEKGVEFWTEDGQLKYRAPKGVMQKSLLARLAEKKQEIISITKVRHSVSKYNIIPEPEKRYDPFPLTDVQRAYWIGRTDAYELGGVSTHFYLELNVENIDLGRLNKAWQKIIEKHDILRIIFRKDGLQQVLRTVPEYKFKTYNLADEIAIDSKLQKVRDEMSHQVMSAEKWPLFDIRAAILPLGEIRLFIGFDCLIGDAWSQLKLFEEWIEIYFDPSKMMPRHNLSFRDYVLGELEWKQSHGYERSKKYWMKRIDNIKLGPSLPLALNPAAIKKPKFRRHSFELSSKQWTVLKGRAASMKLTPTCILLSAFSHVLNYWSGTPSFTINMTLFNRVPIHPEVDEIVGEFTSLNMLSVDFSREGSFQEKSAEIQNRLMKDLDHIHFSGVEVIRELMRQREDFKPASLPVVFTSGLGINSSDKVVGLSRLGEIVYSITQTPQVWLDFQAYENGGALNLSWDSVKGLFPEGLLEDMFGAYCKLIESLVKDEDVWKQPVSKLIPEYQIAKRNGSNSTDSEISPHTLNELFRIQAYQQPNQTAVVTSCRFISYEELKRRSEDLAYLLQKKGAKPNILIGVVMEKGWEQVVAVLGTLISGAAYLPIDPSVPKERLLHILKDGEARLILTQSWLDKRLEWPEDIERICVDQQKPQNKNIGLIEPDQTPEDLAYVIYTSGSTGKPKGVMIDHRGAVNTILDINKRFGIGHEDKVLALSNLSFDLSVFDIFGTLTAGGTIVIPDNSATKDPGHWLKLIKQEKITIWNSVPMLMQMLVEYISGRIDFAPDSLRLAFLSGDWIPLELSDKVRAIAKNAQLVSLGGATEASVWSILYPIKNVNSKWKSIPYGRPMINQKFYVLNKHMEECPDWVAGELYIGGVGLAKGYWKDKEKTEAQFIFHPRTGERLYRTGDLGRYLPDGNIEFLGREDFQVKINGYRIELGEIEAVMKQHPGVKDSVVIVVDDPDKDKFLAGYAVPVKDYDFSVEDLMGFIGGKLAEYMVPSALMILETLPLTSSGKVDRKKLLLSDKAHRVVEAPYIAPKNELEQEIAQIVQEVLKIEKASTHDRFFNMGASSLDIIKIQNILVTTLQLNISVIDFFEYSTVHSLAQYISSNKKEKSSDSKIRKKVEARKVAALKRKKRKLTYVV